METEPTLTYQVFDIILQVVVFIVVMGVGITFLAFLNHFIDRGIKESKHDFGGWSPPN